MGNGDGGTLSVRNAWVVMMIGGALVLPTLGGAVAGPIPGPSDILAEVVADNLLRIGPGSALYANGGCTANFVFENRVTGDVAVGTAGHCYEVGTRVSVRAPYFHENGGGISHEFGTVVYGIDEGVGSDFALIRIDPAWHAYVDPTTPLVGGPCGVAPRAPVGTPVVMMGQSSSLTPPVEKIRPGATIDYTFNAHHVAYITGRTGGDSGAPVRYGEPGAEGDAAPAAAIHTHGLVTDGVPIGFGTTITRALQLIGPEWEMVPSPNCPVTEPALPTWTPPEPPEAPEPQLEPEVFADADDAFATVVYPRNRVSVTAPDGATLRVESRHDTVLFVRVHFNGTVLEVTDLGNYFVKCEPAAADAVEVSGRLEGAAADGTWRVQRSGDFVLDVAGKRVYSAFDPENFVPGGCPETNSQDLLKTRTWNWHRSEDDWWAHTVSHVQPAESPVYWRFYDASAFTG